MISLDAIAAALEATMSVSLIEDEARVVTHCLYPSNGAVVLTVRGSGDTYVVSDDGRAVAEVRGFGLRVEAVDRHFKRLIRNQGLRVDGGAIYSPPVPASAVGAAVVLVANASKEAAHWCLDHFKFSSPRNFKRALAELLDRHFSQELKHELPIVGASNKPHKFEHVVVLPGERKLLIDPVLRDPSSINARVVANLDVKELKDPLITQRIVYDDHEEWSASDLQLLQMGAPLLPFSRASGALRGLVAA